MANGTGIPLTPKQVLIAARAISASFSQPGLLLAASLSLFLQYIIHLSTKAPPVMKCSPKYWLIKEHGGYSCTESHGLSHSPGKLETSGGVCDHSKRLLGLIWALFFFSPLGEEN